MALATGASATSGSWIRRDIKLLSALNFSARSTFSIHEWNVGGEGAYRTFFWSAVASANASLVSYALMERCSACICFS